jgi:hypothetical protein
VRGGAEGFAVLPGMSQTGTNALAQHFAFELSEDRQHGGHGVTDGCDQVKSFSQRDAADAVMFQLLERDQRIGYSCSAL